MGAGEIKPLRVESDPRIGGHYRWLMQAPDGEQHDVSGVYREVIPNEKLVFTWAWKSTPEVTFKRDGDGTIMTLLHEQFFDEAARDRHEGGWTSAMENLEKYLNA